MSIVNKFRFFSFSGASEPLFTPFLCACSNEMEASFIDRHPELPGLHPAGRPSLPSDLGTTEPTLHPQVCIKRD